jgi:hypothetical protein
MHDGNGTPEAQYWVTRNRVRSKFGLSASEADEELAEEVYIHNAIWNLILERKIWEQEKADRRANGVRRV